PEAVGVATIRQQGLAVVARLAARHQVHVQVQAHRGYGTIATITLPPTVLILPAGRHHASAYPTAAPPLAGPPAGRRRPGDVVRHQAGRRPDHHVVQAD